ncbi:hypothetical protein PYCC9005_001932 [Savitreella phatthalungensis]
MSFQQGRRNSARGPNVPKSLDLGAPCVDVPPSAMATPPISGIPTSDSSRLYRHRRQQSSFSIPMTPKSPADTAPGLSMAETCDVAQTGRQDLEELSVGRDNARSPMPFSSPETSGKASRQTVLSSKHKRPLSQVSAASADEARPPKRVTVGKDDMIANPLVELAAQQTSTEYAKSQLQVILEKHIGKEEFSVCRVRALPLESSAEAGFAVRVVPHLAPEAAFSCRFKAPSIQTTQSPPGVSRRKYSRVKGSKTIVDHPNQRKTSADSADSAESAQSSDSDGEYASSTAGRPTDMYAPEISTSSFSSCSSSENAAHDDLSQPMHLEALLLRAQPLYRLLLSGHVLKGDTLELHLPHPERFDELVHWLYSGKLPSDSIIRAHVQNNIRHVWGLPTVDVSSSTHTSKPSITVVQSSSTGRTNINDSSAPDGVSSVPKTTIS